MRLQGLRPRDRSELAAIAIYMPCMPCSFLVYRIDGVLAVCQIVVNAEQPQAEGLGLWTLHHAILRGVATPLHSLCSADCGQHQHSAKVPYMTSSAIVGPHFVNIQAARLNISQPASCHTGGNDPLPHPDINIELRLWRIARVAPMSMRTPTFVE